MEHPVPAPPAGPSLVVRVQPSGFLVGGVASDSAAVTAAVRAHVRTYPDGSIAFSTSRDALYIDYVRALNAIKATYEAEWDDFSLREFGAHFSELSESERRTVRESVPLRITLAEPD